MSIKCRKKKNRPSSVRFGEKNLKSYLRVQYRAHISFRYILIIKTNKGDRNMNINIISLLSEPNDPLLESLESLYQSKFPHALITKHIVNATSLKNCIGCWSCWVKTPGLCIHKDEMDDTYKNIMSSDRVVLAMPTQAQFLSGASKTFIDRLIPLFHPYILVHKGELMHEERYHDFPVLDYYFDQEGLTDDSIRVIEDYLFRIATHFRVDCSIVKKDISGRLIHMPLIDRQPAPDMEWQPLPMEHRNGKIVLYNCSPRGNKGNSLKILNGIVKGIETSGIPKEDILIRHLIEKSNHDEWVKDFHNHSRHFFVMPLYVHAMPGIVMKFFEKIEPSKTGACQLSFFVQSGFTEGFQSHYLRAWLSRFPVQINCLYGGTLIKGGMESLQVKPDQANQKLYAELSGMGVTYSLEGMMNSSTVNVLASRIHLSTSEKLILPLLMKSPLGHLYWDMQLKRNGAYERRFDRPYESR